MKGNLDFIVKKTVMKINQYVVNPLLSNQIKVSSKVVKSEASFEEFFLTFLWVKLVDRSIFIDRHESNFKTPLTVTLLLQG